MDTPHVPHPAFHHESSTPYPPRIAHKKSPVPNITATPSGKPEPTPKWRLEKKMIPIGNPQAFTP
jgi:hypothetical protein